MVPTRESIMTGNFQYKYTELQRNVRKPSLTSITAQQHASSLFCFDYRGPK